MSTMPARKTLGTDYNLRPRTERVRASALRSGDVVMESDEHPALIVRLEHLVRGAHVRVWTRYIWQPDTERPWPMGTFHPDYPFDRAKSGEY